MHSQGNGSGGEVRLTDIQPFELQVHGMLMEHEALMFNTSSPLESDCISNPVMYSVAVLVILFTQALSLSGVQGFPKANPGGN